MPKPSYLGYWAQQSPNVSGQIWPPGQFDFFSYWQVVHLQVFSGYNEWWRARIPRFLPSHNGFFNSTYGWSDTPISDSEKEPLPPKFGNLINGTYGLPLWGIIPGGGTKNTDLVWIKGRWDTSTDPKTWILDNPDPFSSSLSEDFAELKQKHFSKYLRLLPNGESNTISLKLASKGEIQPDEFDRSRFSTIRGPYVITKNTFAIKSKQTLEFWWRAKGYNGCGYGLDAYLTAMIPGGYMGRMLPYQFHILSVHGRKNQGRDHDRKVQSILGDSMPSRNNVSVINNAIAQAENRSLDDVEFERIRVTVTMPGNYKLLFVHSSWDASGNLTFDAESEITGVKLL